MSILTSMKHLAAGCGLGLLLLSGTALAEIDLSGVWTERRHEDFNERGEGPDLVEFEGLPISEAGRQRALSWSASILLLEEYQCRPHPSDYFTRFSPMRITKSFDSATQETISLQVRKVWHEAERTIWLDNRERPPVYAAHTWQGFSLGRWEGDVLAIHTTHLKQSYIRRNGVSRSDRAETREYWARHGDYLTVTVVIHDPANLTESMIRSSDYAIDPQGRITPYPCDPVVEVAGMARGEVPHYLPDQHPYLREYADKYSLPLEAVLGGAETMYPEFMTKLRSARTANMRSAAQ